jgi:hypothetical protein
MNGINGKRKIYCLFNMCREAGLCSTLAEYLTIAEIWLLDTLSIYLLKYARCRGGVDDRFDSFFDVLPKRYRQEEFAVRSTNFLEWCMQGKITLQRLRVDMPHSSEKDSHSSELRKIKDLKKTTSSYLETYGKSVLAIHLNFLTGCRLITNFVATHFILMVFQYCPNLIMLCLEGEPLKFSDKQFSTIFLASYKCPVLRDWVFVGNTLLSSEGRCQMFLRLLSFNLGGSHKVHQLVLNRGNRFHRNELCPDLFTLKNLRCLEENKTVRISNTVSHWSSGNIFWCDIGK